MVTNGHFWIYVLEMEPVRDLLVDQTQKENAVALRVRPELLPFFFGVGEDCRRILVLDLYLRCITGVHVETGRQGDAELQGITNIPMVCSA